MRRERPILYQLRIAIITITNKAGEEVSLYDVAAQMSFMLSWACQNSPDSNKAHTRDQAPHESQWRCG